ncbi:unnamed protein product [Hydatigera taeniaeformis]|uniref:CNH domain-containing protein n=1 Tax=Hydatigena taeniaeformis TaxID=6205 RepID=A0A0R3XBL4_HYDTA|nr:unnamed protein product [Hydatigera taeniaeformis]
MVDLASLATGVIFNPNLQNTNDFNAKQLENDEKIVLKSGDVDYLIYTLDGIVCGGADGRLSTIQQMALAQIYFLDEEVFVALKSDHNAILYITACPSYQNFAILRKSGLVQIFQRDVSKEVNPSLLLQPIKEVRTNVSPFNGICGMNIEDDTYFVVTCMRVIPGLPLAAVGLQNGSMCVVYWVDRRTPRIMATRQIFQSAIEEM